MRFQHFRYLLIRLLCLSLDLRYLPKEKYLNVLLLNIIDIFNLYILIQCFIQLILVMIEHRHALFVQLTHQSGCCLCELRVNWLAHNVKVFNKSKSLLSHDYVFLFNYFIPASPVMLVESKVRIRFKFKLLEFYVDILDKRFQTIYEVWFFYLLYIFVCLQ
jgi:hypothetical protein